MLPQYCPLVPRFGLSHTPAFARSFLVLTLWVPNSSPLCTLRTGHPTSHLVLPPKYDFQPGWIHYTLRAWLSAYPNHWVFVRTKSYSKRTLHLSYMSLHFLPNSSIRVIPHAQVNSLSNADLPSTTSSLSRYKLKATACKSTNVWHSGKVQDIWFLQMQLYFTYNSSLYNLGAHRQIWAADSLSTPIQKEVKATCLRFSRS